jgi:hypothetical protein
MSVRSWPHPSKYFLNHHPWTILPVSAIHCELTTVSFCTLIENKFSVLHPKGLTLSSQKPKLLNSLPSQLIPVYIYTHSIFPDHKLFKLSHLLCQVLPLHEIVLPNKIYVCNNTVSISVLMPLTVNILYMLIVDSSSTILTHSQESTSRRFST